MLTVPKSGGSGHLRADPVRHRAGATAVRELFSRLFLSRLISSPLSYSAALILASLLALTTPVASIAATPAQIDAARLLTQATFGPDHGSINYVAAVGNETWLQMQFNEPPSEHLPRVIALSGSGNDTQLSRYRAFWDIAINAPDQLRQRVALALSEILVISDVPDALLHHSDMLAAYYDVLVRNAFGNYRDLLEAVALSPAMGVYLSSLGNEKPDNAIGRRADENFAREIMQLFSIGLVQLHQDGAPQLSYGAPIPSYQQSDVAELARVFTGWSWNRPDWNVDAISGWFPDRNRLRTPMIAFAPLHDDGSKVFLGTSIPAGQTPEQDMSMVLDILANHPNVGPFISRQLIQRLVTSNPSRGYVSRVAAVFNNNGAGQRGDLRAVVRAILVDQEARSGNSINDPSFGKLREPLLRFSHLWRAFRVKVNPQVGYFETLMTQHAPLTSPTVFNFFRPNFSPTGDLRNAAMVAPEFQINSETRLNAVNAALQSVVLTDSFFDRFSSPLSLEAENSLAGSLEALVDRLNLVLMSGSMSAPMRELLLRYANDNRYHVDQLTMVRQLIALTITSAEYAIQR